MGHRASNCWVVGQDIRVYGPPVPRRNQGDHEAHRNTSLVVTLNEPALAAKHSNDGQPTEKMAQTQNRMAKPNIIQAIHAKARIPKKSARTKNPMRGGRNKGKL